MCCASEMEANQCCERHSRRTEPFETGAFKLLYPVRADVLQEEVLKSDVRCAALVAVFDGSAHRALVPFVGTGLREWYDVERKPDRGRLRLARGLC